MQLHWQDESKCTLQGPLTRHTVQTSMTNCLKAFVDKANVLIDCAGITECDSSAVAMLLLLVQKQPEGQTLAFQNIPSQLQAIIDVSELTDYFNCKSFV